MISYSFELKIKEAEPGIVAFHSQSGESMIDFRSEMLSSLNRAKTKSPSMGCSTILTMKVVPAGNLGCMDLVLSMANSFF